MTDSLESLLRRIIREEIEAALSKHELSAQSPAEIPTGRRRVLGVNELAEELGLTTEAVYDLRRRHGEGALPSAFKVGKYLRWHREDVDTWLAAQAERGSGRS